MSEIGKWRILVISGVVILGAYSLLFTARPALEKTYCQLSRMPCNSDHVNIRLSHDIIKPMTATELTVEWPSLPQSVTALELTLEGHEMMMGKYKLKLSRSTQRNRYNGQIILPFCTSDAMTWKGTISPLNQNHDVKPIFISLRMEK